MSGFPCLGLNERLWRSEQCELEGEEKEFEEMERKGGNWSGRDAGEEVGEMRNGGQQRHRGHISSLYGQRRRGEASGGHRRASLLSSRRIVSPCFARPLWLVDLLTKNTRARPRQTNR